VILVSHHVQLCFTGASYIVALDDGHLLFAGDQED
jgi:ABC-type branched-subunit amino acid transport system ATPase component